MRVRKLALAVGLVGALGTEFTSALGLGEIKLKSTLNQPLNAEIKLLQVRDLSEEEILIRLASQEDFQRASVEREFFLSDINFKVVLNDPSGPYVVLTSTKPVREPFLNFLLETQWPSGRLLREYTLLMDLPVFSDEAVRPIQGAQTQPTPAAPVQAPQQVRPVPREPVPTQTAQPQRRSTPTRGNAEVYGPVTANDTLWEIAVKVRPDRSASVQQTMLALQRSNPEAFIDSNINLLRKGQVLRVPDIDEIYAMSAQQAVNEVALQNSEWSQATGVQLAGGDRVSSGRQLPESGRGRVKLAVAGNSESSASGKGSGDSQGDVEALENELAISMEELDKTKRENTELSSRIHDLEEQIETMERMLDVSNQELRALQLASQQTADKQLQQDGAQSSRSKQSTASVKNTGEQEFDEDLEASEQKPSRVERQRAAKAEAKKAAAADRQIGPKPKEKSFLDIVFDNINWIGGGLLALGVGSFFFSRRRRGDMASEDELDQFDSLSEEIEEESYEEDIMSARAQKKSAHEPQRVETVSEPEAPAEEEVAPVEAETSDVVGEADIYIAYGKFEQAEDMLNKVLSEEPERTDVRLKLMEVYTETKNLEKFDQHYTTLMGFNDKGVNQRAAELRQQFPDAGEFNLHSGAAAQSSDTVETLEKGLADEEGFDELSLDLDLEEDADSGDYDGHREVSEQDIFGVDETEALTLETQGVDDDFDFDFDTEEEQGEALETSLESDDDFELDLDLDEDLEQILATSESSEDVPALEPTAEVELNTQSALHTENEFESLLGEEPQSEEMSIAADTLGAESADDMGSDELTELSLEDLDDGNFPDVDDSEPAAQGQEESIDLNEPVDFSVTELEDDAFAVEDTASPTEKQADEDDFDLDMTDVDIAELDHDLETIGASFDLKEDELDLAFEDENEFPSGDDKVTALKPKPTPERSREEFDLSEDDLVIEDLSADDDAFGGGDTAVATRRETSVDTLAGEDAELDFLADTDEAATKLDLARAYIDMGDNDGAKDILDEVAQEGNDVQRKEAQELLVRIG